MQEKFSIYARKILKVVFENSQSTAISTPNYQSFPLPIFKILVRYLVRILSVYRQVGVSYASRTRQVSAESDDYYSRPMASNICR